MEKYNLNSVRKDLKVVYSENDSINLVFKDNNILRGVVGELDSNLKELEHTYLELWDRVPANKGFTKPGRQILHCTFGSTLLDQNLGPEIIGLLKNHEDTYTEVLCDHFTRHLKSLESGIL